MSRINILYIFHVSSIGGGSFCLLNMVKKLDKELYNPLILLKEDGPLCIELIKHGASIFFEKSISTVPYNRSLFERTSILSIFSVLTSLGKIRYWIKKTDASIVHINTMMMYPYIFPAYKLRKKIVIHVREHWPKNEHRIQFKIAQSIIERYSDKIIAINESSANMIRVPEKTQIIYDWIDFENREEIIDFKKLFGENYKSLKIFLFLGGMQKIKGAIEVVQVFHEKISDENARLLFVGCDVKTYGNKDTFKERIKAVLRFIKFPVFSDKIKAIAQKDNRIIFIPSTNQVMSIIEQSYCILSFPTIPHAILPIAEAIYLGKPVISADTPEAREYSNGGSSALLFEINNIGDFEKKILYAFNNERKMNEMAQKGTEAIKSTFDAFSNSKLLNNIYTELSNKF